MRIDHQVWYSPRLGHDMGVAVFGHWGPPLLAFPTSHGDEWELQRHGLIDAIGDFIDAGRVKVFCVGSNNHESFLNQRRAPVPPQLAPADVRRIHPRGSDSPSSTRAARRRASRSPRRRLARRVSRRQHAASLSRICVKRCYALLGRLRPARLHGRHVRRQLLLPESDGLHGEPGTTRGIWQQLASCEIRLVTGTGPYEKSGYSTRCRGCSARKGIRHTLDDWGRAAATTGRTGRSRSASISRAGESRIPIRLTASRLTGRRAFRHRRDGSACELESELSR